MSADARLRWGTAARIAWRELASAAGRFVFVMLAVGLGVGALTGVRSFSQSFRQMLQQQARTLLAGDLELRASPALTAAQTAALAGLQREHVDATRITQSLSMVAAPAAAGARPPDPVLTMLKAVDPRAYPYAGVVESQPAGALAHLDAQSVLAAPDLLLRTGQTTGGRLTIGGQSFTIAGVLNSEPDRLAGGFSLGPRLMLTQEGLRRTRIIQFGSQVQSRLVFRLDPGAPPLEAVEARLRQAFPHSGVTDARHINPTVQRGLDHSTTFLSLISLMALVVGALGVASAMHAHLQLRLDSIATMKVLGAQHRQIVAIFGLQTLLLGLGGGLLGVGLSAAVERAFPWLLAPLFPHLPALHWNWGPAAEGLAAGVLIALLFTLPTLAGLRRIRPALILRRYVSEPAPAGRRAARALEGGLAALGIGAGVAALAMALTDEPWRDSLRIGGWFLAGLAVGTAALALVGWLLLRGLRLLVGAWSRRGAPPLALRHGLANLYRPGSQAQTVLTALGIGVMFTLSVFLLQRSLLADLQQTTPPGVANVFLLDIPPEQQAGVQALLEHEPGLETTPEIVATTPAELESFRGAAPPRAENDRGGRGGREGRRRYALASAAAPPSSVRLTQGSWWKAGTPGVALSDELARTLGAHLGDAVRWNAGERDFTLPIRAIYQPAPHRLIARVDAIVNPEALVGVPLRLNGGVRAEPAAIPELERDLYARFPTVTVVNLADVIERVQQVVDQVTIVVHFVAFFAILAGAIILASSVAGTRFRRMREMAVLKTLGATRGAVVRIFSAEFLLLGLVAGLSGSLLATGFTEIVTHRLLEVPFRVDWLPNLAAIVLTAALAVASGWLASAHILGQKPLDVLRGE